MSKHIKSVVVLTAICAVVSILLALTNSLTAPIIAEQESAAVNEALAVVLPSGEDFKSVDISKYDIPASVTEAYSEKNGGYAFKLNVTGYQPNMIILCGIDKDGIVKGATCISSSETLGKEKTYGENFKDKSIDDYNEVDTIANATYTTAAYKDAIKDALNAFTILNGGTADLRSEEEILNDNLNTALPEAQGKFEKAFMVEDIEGINAVYNALNGQGFVFIVGDQFYSTDADCKALTAISDAGLLALIEDTAKKIIGWDNQKLDLSAYTNIPSQVKTVYETENGYTFVLHAAGYGINGGDKYHPASGIPIVIKVTATKDGTITSCVTVSQSETANLGSACGDEAFYSQFNGKTEANYSEIDAISGATITTDGYKAAIGSVFETINILKGVS